MKKLFLVDAYALIYKYYYAFLTRPMRNRTGMNTSVVFGFVKFLRDILKRENPDLLGVAFDPKGGSFRRELYPEYKANRPATPEDIALSIPYIKRILDAMCVPVLEVEGFEADDVIGTLSQKAAAEGYEVFMVTPDKDYGQLVRPCCKLYKQKGDGIEIVDCDAIRAHYGFDDPTLVRDVLALWGDASDNIPGVPGIGEKGACKLVQTWGTVENILSNVERIKGRQGESIAAWGDKLLLAKRLTTIRLDVPIEFRPEELTMCPPNLRFSPNWISRCSCAICKTWRRSKRATGRGRTRSVSWPRWRGPNRLPPRRRRWSGRAISSHRPIRRLRRQRPWRTMRRATKRMRCLPNPRWRVRRRRLTTTGSSARPTNCAR